MKRLIAVLAIGAVFGIAVVFAVERIQLGRSLKRAEQIFSYADKLTIHESSYAQVLEYGHQFGGDERSSQPSGECSPADCMVNVYSLSPSDVAARHSWLIKLEDHVGIHPFNARVTMWVKNGKLDAIEKAFFRPEAVGVRVFASVSISNPSVGTCGSLSHRLHQSYATRLKYRPGQMFEYWTDGTQPIPRIELGCASSFRGCIAASQLLPGAWAQHEADQPKISALEANPQSMKSEEVCR